MSVTGKQHLPLTDPPGTGGTAQLRSPRLRARAAGGLGGEPGEPRHGARACPRDPDPKSHPRDVPEAARGQHVGSGAARCCRTVAGGGCHPPAPPPHWGTGKFLGAQCPAPPCAPALTPLCSPLPTSRGWASPPRCSPSAGVQRGPGGFWGGAVGSLQFSSTLERLRVQQLGGVPGETPGLPTQPSPSVPGWEGTRGRGSGVAAPTPSLGCVQAVPGPPAPPGTPWHPQAAPQHAASTAPQDRAPQPMGTAGAGALGTGVEVSPCHCRDPSGCGAGEGQGSFVHPWGRGGARGAPQGGQGTGTGRAGDRDRDIQGTQRVRQGTGGCAGCVSGVSPGRCHQPCPGAGEGTAASPALQPGRRVRVRPQDTPRHAAAARHEPLAALAAAPAPLRDLPALPARGDQPGTCGVTDLGCC